jgi:anti-sigma factor RsiW
MTRPADLSCIELVELVTEYLEDSLPPAERLRFESHIADCRHCRAYLAQMRITIRTLGRLTPEAIPDPVRDDLLQRFRTWREQRAGD